MEEIIKQLQPILITLLIAALTWGATELTRWIKQKTNSSRAAEAVDVVSKAVIESVKEVEQTMRPALARGLTGEMSSSDKLKLREAALKSVKDKINPKVMGLAEKNMKDVNAWLNSKVEASVLDMKRECK
jgi:uncharacterized protein YhaN